MRVGVRIYSKINKLLDKYFVRLRKRYINNREFSIICNNCWGGYVYRRYGLPYLSPTVGVYFFADDFVKLCGDLKKYMSRKLEFISYTESRYREILEKRGHINVPIARLGDIEVVFLHYSTEEEAAEKWMRRAERINYDHLIFKFSMMNCCTEENLKAFDWLDIPKKICFIPARSTSDIKCGIRFRSAMGNEVNNDTAEYARYINLTRMINAKKVCGEHMEGQWNK